ncbi:hypothetical protein IIV22_078R [Invertebrate iridescent virus 22]|uniref:MSV199 domain-containing protein n=1 Tax=Invertebrate iridescent virus 22 TaxID=345198 RepID=S6DF49_9VIRU|nr:hypothetical protein IIV22_078R [Invertebrate iridescent virus 22]CCV01755.1 hypothetical protein IIV22_078R [Invertebrate iridescent virus 22]
MGELKDIFSFVQEYDLTFDVNSNWFQDLWYPLSKFNPPQLGGVKKVDFQPQKMPVIVTQNLLEWMGFKGRNISDKQERFSRVLRSHQIPYQEIGHQHPFALEYPCIQREIKLIPKQLEQKKWICMEPRAFKKAVMRINTENAEIVRDYYLNLEEVMFAYGEYTINFLIKEAEKDKKLRDLELSLAMEQLAIKDKSEEDLRREQEKLNIQLEQEKQRAEKAERKAIRVNKFMRRVSVKEKKLEWIYIATTNVYSQERLFKVGSTTRLSSRISSYNTGRPREDSYYYSWVKKCYNSKDLDYHIQKLLSDFKHKENTELYCGIKFSDLKAIVNFIVDNYDASIDYINNFIKTRLNESLEEEDEDPPRLDYRKITYQIGEHTETIDLEKEDNEVIRDELENILSSIKNQQHSSSILVIDRKELIDRLLKITNSNKKDLWSQIKDYTGWKSGKTEINSGGEFKYKIVY